MLELLSRKFNIKSYYGLSTCKIILVDCMPFYLDASWALLRNSKNYNGVQITDISQNIELPRSLFETSLLFCLVERLRGFWFAYNIYSYPDDNGYIMKYLFFILSISPSKKWRRQNRFPQIDCNGS